MADDKNLSRRTALSILGIAPATALAGEHVGNPSDHDDGSQINHGVSNDRLCAALRRLADDIEAGGTTPGRFTVLSEAVHSNWVKNTMTLEFDIWTGEGPAGRGRKKG